MLGKTVPEPTSDGRVFVCSAGVSRELDSLVRIYPLARGQSPKRWSINRVRLELNPKDSRRESWKIAGDRSPGAHELINQAFVLAGEIPKCDRARLLSRYVVDSIATANEKKISLAVIHPKTTPRLGFKFNPDSPDSPQLKLFDSDDRPSAGSKRFSFIPYLEFEDERGWHNLQLRDWGCYEFLRKQGDDRRDEMAGALHLGADCSLFVGNNNHHRTTWLVISVLLHVREESPQLPLLEGVQ